MEPMGLLRVLDAVGTVIEIDAIDAFMTNTTNLLRKVSNVRNQTRLKLTVSQPSQMAL